MGRLLIAFVALTLTACGTYRTGTGRYNGPGGFQGGGKYRPPSDYSDGVDSLDASQDELQGAQGHLGKHMQYVPAGEFKLFWPVEEIKINRGFHPASDPRHAGIDLGGKMGLPIFAAHEGVVVYAGHEFQGYGNMVIVEY